MATHTCRTCEADGETASRSEYSTVSKAQWGIVWQRFSLKQMHRHVLNSRLPSSAVNRKSAMNIKAKDHQGLKSLISQTHLLTCTMWPRVSFFLSGHSCGSPGFVYVRGSHWVARHWRHNQGGHRPFDHCRLLPNQQRELPAPSEPTGTQMSQRFRKTVAEVLSSNICGNESDIGWLLKAVSNWSEQRSWNSETNDYIQHVILYR